MTDDNNNSTESKYEHILIVNIDKPGGSHFRTDLDIRPQEIVTRVKPENPSHLGEIISDVNPTKIYWLGLEREETLGILEQVSGYDNHSLPPFLMRRRNKEILSLEKEALTKIVGGYFPLMDRYRGISTVYTDNPLIRNFCQLNSLPFVDYSKP